MQLTNSDKAVNTYGFLIFVVMLTVDFLAVIKFANEDLIVEQYDLEPPVTDETPQQYSAIQAAQISIYKAARFNLPSQSNPDSATWTSATPIVHDRQLPAIEFSVIVKIAWFETLNSNSRNRLGGWKDGNTQYTSLSLTYS